jgi:hypothetical protein
VLQPSPWQRAPRTRVGLDVAGVEVGELRERAAWWLCGFDPALGTLPKISAERRAAPKSIRGLDGPR